MSKLFLLNEAIDSNNIEQFKIGMFELILIKKMPNHTFLKHETVYSLSVFEHEIYPNLHGQKEQEILKFIEQMSPYNNAYINNEVDADNYCTTNFNGFLGFDFPEGMISNPKQVTNDLKYKQWCFDYSLDKRHLLDITDVLPDEKNFHFADHHGIKELKAFWKIVKNSPYVISGRSTNFGGDAFIRSINDNGTIEIVLHKTSREYAMHIQTTGKDLLETNAIAEILKQEYDR